MERELENPYDPFFPRIRSDGTLFQIRAREAPYPPPCGARILSHFEPFSLWSALNTTAREPEAVLTLFWAILGYFDPILGHFDPFGRILRLFGAHPFGPSEHTLGHFKHYKAKSEPNLTEKGSL